MVSPGIGPSSSTGSATATPSIRFSLSCSVAATAAAPPLDTDEAITIVLSAAVAARGRAVRRLAAFLVQQVDREPDGVERVAAPVLLGVLLRMGVLDGDPVGERGVELRQLRCGQLRGEVRVRAGDGRVRPHAVLGVDGVGGEVVHTGAGALVGVGDRAAPLEPPLAGGADRAVDAPRAGGCGRDDAGPLTVPARRYLHHQRHVPAPGAVVEVGEVLVSRDFAFASASAPVASMFGPNRVP